MKVFLPFTQFSPIIERVLHLYDWEAVEMRSDTDYPDYFDKRWHERLPFVNLEHDVVPWPGAIDELIDCDQPFCGFAFEPGQIYEEGRCYFGLVRFLPSFIAQTPGIWGPNAWDGTNRPRDWRACDAHLSQMIADHPDLWIHQHFPPVTHVKWW